MSTGLVLASKSSVRRRMLADAGYVFDVSVADLDEAAKSGEPLVERARRLAVEKAGAVSVHHPGSLVIGSDQVGWIGGDGEGVELRKCATEEEAVAQLLAMADRDHHFVSAAALLRGGVLLGAVHQEARVRFRHFDKSEAHAYARFGEWVGSCGGYAIEGRGAQLVDAVEGPLAAVWGMPLYPLLGLLRSEGINPLGAHFVDDTPA